MAGRADSVLVAQRNFLGRESAAVNSELVNRAGQVGINPHERAPEDSQVGGNQREAGTGVIAGVFQDAVPINRQRGGGRIDYAGDVRAEIRPGALPIDRLATREILADAPMFAAVARPFRH